MGMFLAKLYIKSQNYEKASELLKQLQEEDPNDVEVNYELALCLAKMNLWEESLTYCKQVVTIDPTNVKGFNQYGLALYCTADHAEAIIQYEKALEIDPTYRTALNNLAYAYEKNGNIEKAMEKFTQYLDFLPANSTERDEIETHMELLKTKTGGPPPVESSEIPEVPVEPPAASVDEPVSEDK
jgi:tetratricopeptide (TPR) repeat protein